MANTKQIRAKIATTKKTQQTTRAMKMVSAAKLRRAQHNIVNARPYAYKLRNMIYHVARLNNLDHPLLNQNSGTGKMLLVVLTSDRGLCGGFNANIIKYTDRFLNQQQAPFDNIEVIFIGRKGADFFRKKNVNTKDIILNMDKQINYDLAAEISETLWKYYLDGEYDQIRIIYNEFKSAMAQEVIDERLLPIGPQESEENTTETLDAVTGSNDILFEPDASEILEELLTKNFTIQVYRCMQESVAAEHGARMVAMENATKNAGEVIDALTLHYNKVRQASITTELTEITSGAEALKG